MNLGASLTHYRITPKLGEGGLGVVYRAPDTMPGRDVAIKVLPAGFHGNPQSLVRFERLTSDATVHRCLLLITGGGERWLALTFMPPRDLSRPAAGIQASTMRGHAPLTLPKWRVNWGNSAARGSGQTGWPAGSR